MKKEIDVEKLGFKPLGSVVVLRLEAKRAGEEIKSDSGIVLATAQQATQGGVPTHGTVVAVADGCPKEYKELIGYEVALPSDSNFAKMWDPRVVRREITEKSGKDTIYVTCHYSALRSVYTHTDKE